MPDSPTLTIRIPVEDKNRLEQAAKQAGQSITDYVLRSIRRRMATACPACGRDGPDGCPTCSKEKPTEAELTLLKSRLVSDLPLSQRALRCFEAANIACIGDLVQQREGELLRTKNFGRITLKEVKNELASLGLSLRR